MPWQGVEPLLDGLQHWCELIGQDRHHIPNNRHHFFWRIIVGTRFTLWMGIGLTALMLGGALHADTMAVMSRGLRMCLTFVGVIHGAIFWSGSARLQCGEMLVELAGLAVKLEPYSEKHQLELVRVRRYLARSIWLCKFYALLDTCTLIVPLVLNPDELELALWPWGEGRAWVLSAGMGLVFMGPWFACPTFLILAFYCSCLKLEVALYGMLANAIQQADTAAEIYEVAKLDSRLTAACIRVRDTMAGVTTSMLVLVLITPLLSTVLFFVGEVDLFTFASIPYVVMFVTLCALSQRLQDSCRAVASAAYFGKWLEVEDGAAKRTVLVIMARRGRSVGISTTVGVDSLTLASCRETLSSWYSMLQMLLKLY